MPDKLIFNLQPTEQEVAQFYAGLRTYNARFLERDLHPFAITVTNPDGKIVGGIDGESYWGRLHVSHIWVAEEVRGQQLGSQLLGLAEKIASERHCRGVDLDTFSFQAPGFYEKRGYKKMGTVSNFKDGYERYYFSKEIQPSS